MTNPAIARMTEREWQHQVLQVARMFNWTVYHPWSSQNSQDGFPDLTMVRPPRVLFVELKTASGRLSASQRHWGEMLARCPGVEYAAWRPNDFEDVERVLA